jgi:hypothetical protein
MIRFLRRVICVLFLVASFALVALWVRSFDTADQLRGRLWGEQSFVIASKEGRTTAVLFRWTRAPGYLWRWELVSIPAAEEYTFPWNPAWVQTNRFGFGWNGEPDPMQGPSPIEGDPQNAQVLAFDISIPGLSGAGPIAPFWFLVLCAAALAGFTGTNWPFRFSVRGMFVAVTIIGIVLALEVQLGR